MRMETPAVSERKEGDRQREGQEGRDGHRAGAGAGEGTVSL